MALNSLLVCIDANILFDVLFPNRVRCDAVAAHISTLPEVAITALSVHLAVHFATKAGMSAQETHEQLSRFKIIPLDEASVAWAFDNHLGVDFEDALQVGCAVMAGCKQFVTADAELAKQYMNVLDIKLIQ